MESPNIARAQITAALYVFLFFMVYGISMLVPPFQSPDEHDHFQRAYLLSHGKLMLDTPEGESSGGKIDTGLLSYISNFIPLQGQPDSRVNSITESQSTSAQWTGKEAFRILPGTGYYFPAIYFPQATAIFIGESFKLSVDTTYRFARFLSMAACLLILIIAFNIYKPSPLALIVIALPMTLFQMGSTTIDGLSIALSFLAISCFKKDIDTNGQSRKNFALLALTLFILITCRSYMIPMALMLIGAVVANRSRTRVIISSATIIAIIAWIGFAMTHTADLRISGKSSLGTIISYYLADPLALWAVISATLTHLGLMQMYWHSFIGMLGALDTSLSSLAYQAITLALAISVLINLNKQSLSNKANIVLLLSGLLAIPLIYAAMLFTWTPHPATVILGVQGRYFAIPAILILYALERKDDFLRWFSTYLVVITVAIIAVSSMTPALLGRYYVSLPGPSIEPTVAVEQIVGRKPSPELGDGSPIKLGIPKGENISRIGVLFGTYKRTNPGNAKLVLTGKDNKEYEMEFKLKDIEDNKYHYFAVNPGVYDSAIIKSAGGHGISVWEYDDGENKTPCVTTYFKTERTYKVDECASE